MDLVGKSFGVVKFTASGSDTCDFSIPRRDSKTGPGHRDFRAEFDEFITPREAASRRDFTINAMSFDPIAGEVWDFFGGQVDLNNRILRATSDAFSEDPLRVLRGMQFACRFNLTVDPMTAAMSRSIAREYGTLARERIAEEFMKWAVKSAHPGRIGEYLQATGWIGHFPEIENLFGVPQDPRVASRRRRRRPHHARLEPGRAHCRARCCSSRTTAPFSCSLRSPTTSPSPPPPSCASAKAASRWTSWGHEPAGGPMARAFLERIGIKSAIVDQVVPLVENHLAHHSIGPDVTPRAVRRLAMRVAPASIGQLVRLIEADASGRPPLEPGVPPAAARILAAAESEAVESRPQPPLILGRHVLPYFDDRPGVHIGEVTNAAYEAQADGAFSSQEEALRWLDQYMAQRGPSLDPRATGR